jgi:hypothetical protein
VDWRWYLLLEGVGHYIKDRYTRRWTVEDLT